MTQNLKPIARKIQGLEKKTIANTLEIGKLLQEAFDSFEHGDRAEYHEWIKTEFAWSERTAARYRDVYHFCQSGKFDGLDIGQVNISISALYLLAEQKPEMDETVRLMLTGASYRATTFGGKRRLSRKVAADILHDAESELEEIAAAKAAKGKPMGEPEQSEGQPEQEHPDPAPEHPQEPERGPVQSPPRGGEPEPEHPPEHHQPADDDTPPKHNELSQALETLMAHTVFSDEWRTATRLIDAVGLTEIMETLRNVTLKYFGADALKEKANRAEAQTQAKLRQPETTP
jgi:hypothetical protein